jgi:hypothetical protein
LAQTNGYRGEVKMKRYCKQSEIWYILCRKLVDFARLKNYFLYTYKLLKEGEDKAY